MTPDLRTPDVVTVAISRADGGLTVMRVITTEYRPASAEEKEEGLGDRVVNWTIEPTPEYVEGIIAKHDWPPELRAVSWRFVPNDFVDESTDRYFRNAWQEDGGSKPGVHMPKAREIHRAHLRRMRAPLLEALDIEYAQADEEGLRGSPPAANLAKKQALAARKQALRDVTADPAIEAAMTPEELKAVIPSVLLHG